MKETELLQPENLPLDLGEPGIIVEANVVIPGVYDVVLEQEQETSHSVEEAYIVFKSTINISDTAKRYGEEIQSYPGFLVYMESCGKNPRYIIGYELLRYKILHHLPLPENETIRDIAAYGTEMYPDYFGFYPVPISTPWGCTTRHRTIANGLYWLETEQCQRGLAISFPRYDDLSGRARSLAEKFSSNLDSLEGQEPQYLFFREADSSVPLFELLFEGPTDREVSSVNKPALMNAIYKNHPEYVAMHNVAEQVGQHDGLGLFLNTLNIPTELRCSADGIIRLFPQAGTEFIEF